LSAFTSPGGRLPGFAQRRLDELIARGNAGELTATEQQELSEALEYVDEKSIELMAYAAEMLPASPQPAPAAPGDRSPLWRGYIQERLRQLCG
jgi:hypothetical protein